MVTAKKGDENDADVVGVLRWLAGLAPTRLTGGSGERAVHAAISKRLERAGFEIEWQRFRFSRHIYGSLALHFGLAVALAWLSLGQPLVAAAGTVVVAWSFVSEAALRRHFLRALWPKVETQNVLATLPAKSGTTRRRLVFAAHVDSAYTGLMFRPALLKAIAAPPPKFLPFLKKQLFLPLLCVVALAAFEGARARFVLPAWPLIALSALPLLVFVLNAEIVVRNRVVPGAGDNLTGCAAQIVLAEAWAKQPDGDTEVVFAFTGAEEAGTGGAAHLARAKSHEWDRAITSVIILDTLSNGELFMLEEGELWRRAIPKDLADAVAVAASDASLAAPPPYVIPAGATDALPFLVEGYRALALTCIDPEQHAPRNYHHPNDTVDRVDVHQLRASTVLAESLLRRLSTI